MNCFFRRHYGPGIDDRPTTDEISAWCEKHVSSLYKRSLRRAIEQAINTSAEKRYPTLSKMTTQQVESHNAAYFGIPVEWASKHMAYMDAKMNSWPQSLQNAVQSDTQRFGTCGEVIAVAVANWMKEEFAAGRPF